MVPVGSHGVLYNWFLLRSLLIPLVTQRRFPCEAAVGPRNQRWEQVRRAVTWLLISAHGQPHLAILEVLAGSKHGNIEKPYDTIIGWFQWVAPLLCDQCACVLFRYRICLNYVQLCTVQTKSSKSRRDIQILYTYYI